MSTWTVLGTITVDGVPQSVREARRYVSSLLTDDEREDTVILLLSEAVTNSVMHSDSRHGGRITVTVAETDGGAVRIEVVDDGAQTVPQRCPAEGLATSGRGVALIEDLADRSGHCIDGDGRLHTWFQVG